MQCRGKGQGVTVRGPTINDQRPTTPLDQPLSNDISPRFQRKLSQQTLLLSQLALHHNLCANSYSIVQWIIPRNQVYLKNRTRVLVRKFTAWLRQKPGFKKWHVISWSKLIFMKYSFSCSLHYVEKNLFWWKFLMNNKRANNFETLS